MGELRVKYIKVEQHEHSFYLCKLSNLVLASTCNTSMDKMKDCNDEKIDAFQRKLDHTRTKSISTFAKRDNGVMPSGIVLNSKKGLNINGDDLIINTDDEDLFFIIDGQHRIYGAKDVEEPYEFPVIIFDNIDESLQNELFISINNEQKKVNANVKSKIMASDKIKTPEKVLYMIAYELNSNEVSPFYKLIKMDDRNSNSSAALSVSAFINAFVNYIYDKNDYYILKDSLEKAKIIDKIANNYNKIEELGNKYNEKPLWKFYSQDREDIMFKIILNYFDAVKELLIRYWNKNTILYKTTGFNALALLFGDIIKLCNKDENYSYFYILSKIKNIDKVETDYSVADCGLGKVASKNLYNKFIKVTNIKSDYFNYSQFADYDDE